MAERSYQGKGGRSGGSRGGKPGGKSGGKPRRPEQRGGDRKRSDDDKRGDDRKRSDDRKRTGGRKYGDDRKRSEGRKYGDDRKRGDERGRDRGRDGRSDRPEQRRKTWDVSSGQLPKWISEELARVTPKANLTATADLLQQAAEEFAEGKHGRCLKVAQQAKELSPRDATIRELMALSAYRLGQWPIALRELRTYRRYTGDTTHVAVEMDVLRATDRPDDVDALWDLMRRLGGSREAKNEAKVVYGAHLLDRGEPKRAWEITNPTKLTAEAGESDMRVWYVASRAAAELGDLKTARRLFEAIQKADPAFPALDELERTTRGV